MCIITNQGMCIFPEKKRKFTDTLDFFEIEAHKKNYLRCTMSEERLSELAVLSIEMNITESLTFQFGG